MRELTKRSILRELTPAPERKAPENEKEFAYRLLLEHSGPRAAGWIVRTFRKQLRTKGAHDFEVWRARRKEVKPYFFVAMAFLAKRHGWEVQEFTKHKGKLEVFRLKWKMRGHYKKLVEDMRCPA